MKPRIGVVVIGRNEGERLRACLQAIPFGDCAVVYVDSGSTDGSLELARRFGAHGVALDMARPFTAARARNAGVAALLRAAPDVEFVQFLDGDCELARAWLASGLAFLQQHPRVAVVSGRVRERDPQRSVFNRLCDWEWDTPVGEASECGGNALMRLAAFRAAGGFRDELIAGEEPELCVRLRRAGWKVHRIAGEMVLHDAAMTRFAQWWRRTTRSGHAFAEGAWLHGLTAGAPRGCRETLRAVLYGGLLPGRGRAARRRGVAPGSCGCCWCTRCRCCACPRGRGGYTRASTWCWDAFPSSRVLKFAATRLTRAPGRMIEYK